MAADSPRLRLSILGIVALSLFAALFARLWYLQVIGTEEYQLAAEVQNTRQIAVEAPRGRIVDLKGRVVVDNRTSIVITVDPTDLVELDDPDEMLTRLAEELTRSGQPTKLEDLHTRLEDPQYSPIEPVPVATDITDELEVYLLERGDDFAGVDVRREAVRIYPYGRLASHVLGYVGRISEEEYVDKMGTLDAPVETDKPYEVNDHVGKTGVERSYEDELRGTPGVRTVEVDARGEIIRTISYQAPEPGNDIQLTIDLDVQSLAEAALVEGLEQARARPPVGGNPRNQSPAGAVVVQNPRNGAIVAMASYPTYSPEEFIGGISTERYQELLGSEASSDPFTNRAIAGQYAPGSTFKLITAYAALSHGLIGEYTPFYDEDGVYQAQGCEETIEACEYDQPGGGSGSVTVESAITISSDTFFYWLGDRFWVEPVESNGIQNAAEEFGMHSQSGVPLPFEQPGWIPTAERKAQRHEENEEAFPYGEWYSGDNIITAVGQGDVLVTPLQLANAYSTFANRGTRYEPSVVWRILEHEGDVSDPDAVIEVVEPVVGAQLDMPDHVWNPMYRGFRGVPVAGTARGAFTGWPHNSWPLAAKTGTAEVSGGRADTSVFVAYGPADNPQYTVAAILEESGDGAASAAPVTRWIFEALSGQVPLYTVLTVEEQFNLGEPDCPEPEIEFDPLAPFATTTTSTTLPSLVPHQQECPA